MEGIKYNAEEDRFGGITLSYFDYSKRYLGANDIRCKRSVYLQGDDANVFLAEWESIIKIWTRKFGKFKDGKPSYRKSFGPYKSYAEHFDAIVEPYTEVME